MKSVVYNFFWLPHIFWEVTESGEKALAWCREHRPDIAVLDMIMDPGMNGHETLSAIRQIYPDLPAVILSGFSRTGQVAGALDLGRARFLKKPYALGDLARVLARGLAGS